VKGEAVKPV